MKLALAFVLTFGPSGRGMSAPSHGDHWLGRDKLYHFAAAAAIQSLAYAAWRRDETSRTTALWRATAVTAAVSLGKEVIDWRQGRPFSGRDLVWDAGGAGVATMTIIQVTRR